MEGPRPRDRVGARALNACQEETASNCAGLAAAGGRYYRDGDSDQKITYQNPDA